MAKKATQVIFQVWYSSAEEGGEQNVLENFKKKVDARKFLTQSLKRYFKETGVKPTKIAKNHYQVTSQANIEEWGILETVSD